MVLTDTPGTAFDKISNIVRSLPIIEDGHSYILTIQDLFTKYLMAVPLKQATSAEALVEKFINTSRRKHGSRIRDRIL